MSQAATAILVKSRAKYGKRLTGRDYNELLSCQTISDIANYLKANTHYSVTLEGIKEAAVHRGNLEMMLKQKMLLDFAQLCKFERSVGEHYFEYITLKGEIDQIIKFLRYFVAGTAQNYLFALPDFFIRHSKIDFLRLTQAKNFDDILQVFKGTVYYKLLLPFSPLENENIDFTTIESVLDRYLFSQTEKLMSKYFTGDTKKQLLNVFGISAELANIRKIYRSKKYYNISDGALRALLNEQFGYLNKRQLNKLITSEKPSDVLDILKTTRYRHVINKTEFLFIDDLSNRILYDYCRRKVRFSSQPAVVMASAIVLFEIEIENITNIIEGKRYGVEADRIKPLLILD